MSSHTQAQIARHGPTMRTNGYKPRQFNVNGVNNHNRMNGNHRGNSNTRRYTQPNTHYNNNTYYHNNKGHQRRNTAPTPSWPLPFPRPDPDTTADPNMMGNRRPHHHNCHHQHGGEIPHGDNSNPVCLDYLKGVCSQKRWKCKYAHPPLWLVPKGPASERHVCTVYVLTGFCKYGDRCFGLHPPLNDPICQPAKTAGASNLTQDDLRWCGGSDHASHCGSDEASNACTDETSSVGTRGSTPPPMRPGELPVHPQQPVSTQAGGMAGVKKVLGLLNRLSPERFDAILKQLFVLLTSQHPEEMVSLQQVLPIVFGKAVTEPLLCPLYARLCKHLHDLVPPQQQPAVFNNLCDLSNQLFYQDYAEIPFEQMQQLKKRLLGTGQFVGELYHVGLFSKAQMVTKLEHLVRVSRDQGTGSDLAVETACYLLSVVGQQLEREDPMSVNSIMTSMLNSRVTHPVRTQCLLDNLAEARARGWEKKH